MQRQHRAAAVLTPHAPSGGLASSPAYKLMRGQLAACSGSFRIGSRGVDPLNDLLFSAAYFRETLGLTEGSVLLERYEDDVDEVRPWLS